MKFYTRTLLLLSLTGMVNMAFANEEKVARQEIKTVTVFRQGAQVQTQSKLALDPGQYDIIFEDLPGGINKNQLQLSCPPEITILSLHIENDFLKSPEKREKIKILEDSLKYYSDKLSIERIRKFTLDEEEKLILNNQKLGNEKSGTTAVEIEDMAQLYRTRLLEVKTKSYEMNDLLHRMEVKVAQFRNQLNTYKINQPENTTLLTASISCRKKMTALFNLDYITMQAGWNPLYDIRSAGIGEPLLLSYKASVYQTTGSDWNNIKLTLSTGNPSENGIKPELSPWYLNFKNGNEGIYLRSSDASMSSKVAIDGIKNRNVSMESMAQQNETDFARVFEIIPLFSVASVQQPKIIEIQKYELEAGYSVFTTPKLDPAAYLIAELKDWEKLGLVPANANVYFEGGYVGETFINPDATGDTLRISLGKDKSILVKREKIKELNSERFLGSTKKVGLSFEITLHNTHSKEIEIHVEDQLPIVQNKDIELKIIDLNDAKKDETSGKLSWKIHLDADEEKKIKFSFEIKYPKDKQLHNL